MKQVLITGGDGYLGRRIAQRYLSDGAYDVVLWVHAAGPEQVEEKRRVLQQQFGADWNRLSVHYGELREASAFDGVDARRIVHIVHSAAVIRFNVDYETASAVNVEGTRKLLDFARGCPRLERLGVLSSLYASGLAPGRTTEERFTAESGHANHYEWSKWAAEELLFTDYRDLPWCILRVATIVADDVTGTVTQYNAVHNTLKLFFYGLLSVLPGKAGTPLYLATGDFIADAVLRCMAAINGSKVYHLTHDRDAAVRLGEFIDVAYQAFSDDPQFAARRVLKPLYADLDSFNLLADSVNQLSGPAVTKALASVSPFAAQLFVDKQVSTEHLVPDLALERLPDMRDVIRRACRHLAATRWGRA